jgi:hypothetical protein
MKFVPDKCPVCNGDWVAIEESILINTMMKRDEDDPEEYDWDGDSLGETAWDSSEPIVTDGKVSVRCQEGCDHDGILWLAVEMDPVEEEKPVLINITWTEQHNATVTVAGPPESIDAGSVVDLFEDAYDRFKEEQDRNRTFQQVTQVHEWEVVDE